MNPILLMTETACVMLAVTASTASTAANIEDLTIYNGFDNEVKKAPAVICTAESAKDNPGIRGTGIWRVKTDIKVKEIANDTAIADRGNLSGVIFEAFLNPDAITNLNNQLSNYYVFDIFPLDNINSEQGDAWVQTLSLDIMCALKN